MPVLPAIHQHWHRLHAILRVLTHTLGMNQLQSVSHAQEVPVQPIIQLAAIQPIKQIIPPQIQMDIS
jgi:hypothetical protein